LLLSLFIYLEHLGVTNKALNTVFAVIGFYLLIYYREALAYSGFFIGLFWFHWISLSFIYYDLSFLIPFVALGVALIYSFIFWLIKFLKYHILIATAIFAFEYFHPFNFNWFKPSLTLINSYFGVELYQFAILLLALVLVIILNRYYKLLALILLIFSLDLKTNSEVKKPDLKIFVTQSEIDQSIKWDKKFQKESLNRNLKLIDYAIENSYDLIILPESAFAMYLNLEDEVLELLKEKSSKIAIITGALKYENEQYFNSSYYFNNGNLEIADKVVLVPFGERVPFPRWLADIINYIFFNSAKDYTEATAPTDFKLHNYKFRNAICFEASRDEIYTNAPDYIVALSNNGWFYPSIEPTLQNLLIKLYAKRFKKIVYHSANFGVDKVVE